MDNQLLTVIHKYAEDREIDWTSAKVIGEQYGKVFKSEDDLREWKQTIDNYLKTFSAEAFEKVEEACKKKPSKVTEKETPKKKVVKEGKDQRGKQDGTGPYKGSARKGKGPMTGDKMGMADTLVKKGIAKNKKQAEAMCKRYQDPKTGKVDMKKLQNDIKKKNENRKNSLESLL